MKTDKRNRVLKEITQFDHFPERGTGRVFSILPGGKYRYWDHKVYASLSRQDLIRMIAGQPITLTSMGKVILHLENEHGA